MPCVKRESENTRGRSFCVQMKQGETGDGSSFHSRWNDEPSPVSLLHQRRWNTVTPLEKAEIGNIVKMGHEYSYINDATNSTPLVPEMEWYVHEKPLFYNRKPVL